ncbi:acyl carrier protein [Parabacteroides sp. ZJ-118]|uniref:acyl carrier protein n=1 Tax=Parabacteroides sp. ZJ-118 TaxID=2709398 RepID=UPI0013EA3B68|nr:acyl carrier protein [Parabacteroides sp. ZJ-118]
MEIKEFIEKFAEIFDDTDASMLTPTTKFRELDEWSSLTALGVIALADEEFDVELSGTEMRQAKTIEDLFNLITSK